MATCLVDATPKSPSTATDLSIARAARGGPTLRVVDGVSFVLAHGGSLAVMGPTGAGKSSLAAVLAGVGRVRVWGSSAGMPSSRASPCAGPARRTASSRISRATCRSRPAPPARSR